MIVVLSSLLLLLLVLSAFCSSSETVFFSLNPIDIRRHTREHPVSGRRIHDLLVRPTRLLSAILILNTLVNISASSLSYGLVHRLGFRNAEQITIPAMTLLLLVFGEFGPKRLGLLHKQVLARIYGPVLQGLVVLTTPLRRMLEAITHAFGPVFRARGHLLSGEEFETVVDMSGTEGVINAEELGMIKAIIDLEDLRASDVMTPRVDLKGIDVEDRKADVVRMAREAKLHYLLLFRGTPDELVGFLDVRRFLLDPEHRVEPATLTPGFVPESLVLNRLLRRFQQEKRRIAAVVDEYGGLAGVITRGDILEAITGDMFDGVERVRPAIQQTGEGRWTVDPATNLEELNRALDLELDAEGVDRLSGWIASRLGRLPERGDVVQAQGCRVTVLRTDGLRVTLADVERVEEGRT